MLWLHLVKTSAEILVSEMQSADASDRSKLTQMVSPPRVGPLHAVPPLLAKRPTLPSTVLAAQHVHLARLAQIAHVSKDLRVVMDRRARGLDEDWSEDALSAEEEVEEDRNLCAAATYLHTAQIDAHHRRCRASLHFIHPPTSLRPYPHAHIRTPTSACPCPLAHVRSPMSARPHSRPISVGSCGPCRLDQMQQAVSSVTGAKGVASRKIGACTPIPPSTCLSVSHP